jgi:hypothetical protein
MLMTTIAWFLALAALYIGWVYIRVVIEVYRHTKAMANSDYAIERFEPVAGPSLEQIPPGFEPHENLFLGFAGNPIQLDSWYNPASGSGGFKVEVQHVLLRVLLLESGIRVSSLAYC